MPRLAEAADSVPGLTWPTLTFSDRLTIDLGGDRGDLVLQYHGRGHTEGDIIAWLPRHKILFAGDLVEAEAALYTGDAFHREWAAGTLDGVAALGAEQLVGGRGASARGRDGGRRRDRADPRLPRGHAARGRRGAARGGTLKEAFEATHAALASTVRQLADLRALPAVRRLPRVGRAVRHRAAGHLDRRARPARSGPAAGLTSDPA